MRDRERLINRIYDRGDVLRRRRVRRRAAVAGSGVVLAVALATVALPRGRHDEGHVVVGQGDRTTTSTTTGASTSVTGGATTTTAAAPRSTPTTSLVCRNSGDPRCGTFHYDPPLPPDRVPTIHVAVAPLLPAAGEDVTFTVTIDDPDGELQNWCATFSFTADNDGVDPPGSPSQDRQVAPGGCAMVAAAPKYGPWDPPPPFHAVMTFHATYVSSGTHVAQVDTGDFGSCGGRGCPLVRYRQDVGVG